MKDIAVVIAVLTYRRPDDLHAILPLLIEQKNSVDTAVEILVIDNDPQASAAVLTHDYSGDGVRYVHEPQPGIAAARNRALAEGMDADVLVFIDDDERPVERWLALLIDTWSIDKPAAVVGPVISEFSSPPDSWVSAGEFFTRRRLSTGSNITVAATNNLLLDVAQLREFELSFDARFGLTGGSDTLFSRDLIQRGGRMVWCDEAIVFDIVPTSRITHEWVLQRAYRSGNSWSRTTLALAKGPIARLTARFTLSALGCARLAAGAMQAAYGRTVGSERRHAKGCRTAKRGGGMLSGAWGGVYAEYGRS